MKRWRTGSADPNYRQHVLCVKTELLHRASLPWPGLMRLFNNAGRRAMNPAPSALVSPIVGPPPWPYGLEANRTGINSVFVTLPSKVSCRACTPGRTVFTGADQGKSPPERRDQGAESNRRSLHSPAPESTRSDHRWREIRRRLVEMDTPIRPQSLARLHMQYMLNGGRIATFRPHRSA